jgi:hypothetical protein
MRRSASFSPALNDDCPLPGAAIRFGHGTARREFRFFNDLAEIEACVPGELGI